MSNSQRLDSSRQDRLSLVWPSWQRLCRKLGSNSSRQVRLNMVIASLLELEETGKAVNQPDLLRTYPDLADDLRSFFDDLPSTPDRAATKRSTRLIKLSIIAALVGVVVIFPSWSLITLAVIFLLSGMTSLANTAINRFLLQKPGQWLGGLVEFTGWAALYAMLFAWLVLNCMGLSVVQGVAQIVAGSSFITATLCLHLRNSLRRPRQLRAIEEAGGVCVSESGLVVKLYLVGNRTTDATLRILGGLEMPHLQQLILTGSDCTDRGMEHLKGLTSLQSLGLRGTQVTDAGLEHLAALTNLRRLNLEVTAVTDESVTRLQQALPNCKILVQTLKPE